jgi:hypothetical protein
LNKTLTAFPKPKNDEYLKSPMRTTAGDEENWSTKKDELEISKYPFTSTFSNFNNVRYSRGVTTSYSPLKTMRNATNEKRLESIFAIPNEDKIFDDEKLKRSVEFIRRLREQNKTKIQEIDINKKGPSFSLNPMIKDKIKIAKRQKHLELDVYQKNLVKSLNGAVRNDLIKSLESNLLDIRIKYYKVPKIESMNTLFNVIKIDDNKTITTLRKSYDKVVKYKNRLKKKGILDFNI